MLRGILIWGEQNMIREDKNNKRKFFMLVSEGLEGRKSSLQRRKITVKCETKEGKPNKTFSIESIS